eukprot:PhM_4_TR12464/c0_g1_i1/m.79163/K08517/SEC22; vesicle transport protein SEC22
MASKTIISTSLVRLEDKLVLCSSGDTSHRTKESHLIESLNSIDAVAQSSRNQDRAHVAVDVDSDKKFYVMVDWSQTKVIYVALCHRVGNAASYFSYLEDLAKEFASAFTLDQIRAVQTPYGLIKFENYMVKAARTAEKRIALGGSAVMSPLAKSPVDAHQEVSSNLKEVQDIIRTNLEDMVMRGSKLETMAQHSAELKEHSSKFRHKAVKLNKVNWAARVTGGVVFVLICLYIYYKVLY